ncbi:AEC family transporter [Amaricoccus solimangrovi]|uniref:AEC family transporter n=1 Tax=Amaricoccus solimangrovi TaxID=2589815 RepID=UPI0015E3AEAF|nr:AEC family transporter [Amaricoccus solimangrovi]
MILSVLGVIAPVFLIIAAGYVAVRSGYFGDALRGLGAFVFKIAMPALVLSAITSAPLGDTLNHAYLLGYGGTTLGLFALGYLAARRIFGRAVTPAAVRALGVCGSNTGFMGYPIATMVIGPSAAGVFAQNMIIENMFVLPIAMAIADIGLGQSRSRRGMILTMGASLARNPLMVAIMLGGAFAATGLTLPPPVAKPISMLAAVAAPLALFVVGGTLAGLETQNLPTGVGRIVAGKLVLHPLLVALVLGASGVDPATFATGVIFAGAPIMSMYPIIGGRFGEAKLTATALFAATVCSAATLSVILALLGHWGLVEI